MTEARTCAAQCATVACSCTFVSICAEGIESPVEIREAWARIFHLNHGARAILVSANLDLLVAGEAVQGVAGIVEQIQQHLLDFIFVNGEQRKIRRYVDLNGDF